MRQTPDLFAPGVLRYADIVAAAPPWVAGGSSVETGLDCKGLAAIMVRRAGREFPGHPLLTDPAACFGAEATAAVSRFKAETEAWEGVPEATLLGDMIVNMGDTGPHLSVLVDEKRALVITTMRDAGVRVLPRSAIRDVLEVMRFRRMDRS